ncbi:PREDICTED: protein S100-A8 [Myotis davidii]|uniref:Protein S100-A8 n=1 Tax=Myotis davidii TaxID=225400 RepID=L5MCF4_MYODS|nr:PREDICTED: protein S100-A8 [Myotis davidii]XP_015414117.1 PREDICTED: protein S100-A8 [Myotis davidii]ELK36304.1 Protein S100-A8 [Myotis davidii]
MLTEMENTLNNFIEIYHKYSKLQGSDHALYRDDLKKLLEDECPHFLQKKNAETWFKELDINRDSAINFQEYLSLVIKVGLDAHDEIHKE